MPRARRFADPAIAGILLCSAAIVAVSSQTQRTPARNAVRNSAISGVVTDGATGRGIPGVVVGFSAQGASHNTVTDSKGRFVFRNLPAVDAGYFNAEKPGYVSGGLARRNASFSTTPISVGENEWISDANILMWRPGGISGTVVDEKGEPVVGVPIRVLSAVPIAGNTYWAGGQSARTDDRGYYRISGLSAGRYLVNLPSVQSVVPPDTSQATIHGKTNNSVVPQAFAQVPGVEVGRSWLVLGQYATPPPGGREAYPPLYYPNARIFTEATAIDLANSEERRNIAFVMRPVPAVRVSGRVTGPREAVAGLVVRLVQEGVRTLGFGSEEATALVAADGTFTMVNVPAGRYVLEAKRQFAEITTAPAASNLMPATPGFVSESAFSLTWITGGLFEEAIRTRRLDSGDSYAANLPISIGADDLSNIVLTLERGSSISGRIVREDGSPLPAYISISADAANGDPALKTDVIDRAAARDKSGAFVIRGLERGRYFLRAGATLKSIATGGADFTNRPLEITPGADITDVIVTLAAEPAALSGNVRSANGSAVRDAAVIVFPTDPEQWTDFGIDPPRIRIVTFFGNSKYRLPRLPAGEYFVIAVDPAMRDSWRDPRFFRTAAAVATRVSLGWGKSGAQDLVLQLVSLR